ncbi:reverse transcriptase domain-containing protein [Tanacetum coccineum]|uniref:Reverse transcriptase domain-containing protein n=1 Tax=Tanacetum coccineum TaxID=301880 RepID=A0ABQ5J328_9ASTR
MVLMVPYEACVYLCGAEDVVLRESYKPKTRDKLYYPRQNYFRCETFLWKEERVHLLIGSLGASTTPIYSPGSSLTQIYSPGFSTPPRYSPRASTPQSYSLGTSRNAECSMIKITTKGLSELVPDAFLWFSDVYRRQLSPGKPSSPVLLFLVVEDHGDDTCCCYIRIYSFLSYSVRSYEAVMGHYISKCMRTRNSNFPNNSNVTIPRRRNKGRVPKIVEPELRTIVAPMAEHTMEELLYSTTEVYGEAIVLPEINADHFEIKTNLLQLVQANPFHGLENENPHAHINSFKRITSTLRFRNVPNDVIKLMMFPYSLEGAAKTWYEKEPPNSILTWEDLVTKFVNQFFPPSKTTHLKNKISRFTQKFDESFRKVLNDLRNCLELVLTIDLGVKPTNVISIMV